MEVDSVSPSDFIRKRPSTTALAQPSNSRARVSDGNNQLALTVTAKPKPDRERDDDGGTGEQKATVARFWDYSNKCDHGEWQKK